MAKGAALVHIEVQISPQYMQAGIVSDLSHGWKGRHTVLFFGLDCQFLVVGRYPPWAQKNIRARGGNIITLQFWVSGIRSCNHTISRRHNAEGTNPKSHQRPLLGVHWVPRMMDRVEVC